MLLAERGGIDPGLAARAMTGSAIGSPMLQARAPLVLDLPEQAWFDVQLMHKDIRLALEAGRAFRVTLPAASATDRVLSQAEEQGYGHRDIAGLFQVQAAASAPGQPAVNAAGAGPRAA
jgi:3-hydroxyisobutyrate dehydrogenase-like beta-hydroxyacid dehydrogenase